MTCSTPGWLHYLEEFFTPTEGSRVIVPVVRLWREPAEAFLWGPLGAMPLAVLARLPVGLNREAALTAVVERMRERLVRESAPDESRRLMTTAFLLAGMRVPRAEALRIFKGMQGMRSSTTYQHILDEGRLEEARKILLALGADRFGPADASTAARLAGLTDLGHLERLVRRVLHASDWADVLRGE